MFTHRKVLNQIVDEEWTRLKKTISNGVAYKAAEVIGEYTATDMLDFASLDKFDINRIYGNYSPPTAKFIINEIIFQSQSLQIKYFV